MKNFLLSFLLVLTVTTILFTNSKAQSPILWSTAQSGGTNGDGTIFNFNTAANQATEAHAFGSSTDGSSPNGLLLKAGNGLLYGTTYEGGAKNVGVIFSYDISSGTETPLYGFLNADTDAQYPSAPLIQGTDTLLYGTTISGGDSYEGALYSFNISSNTLTVLHGFGAGNDARTPQGALFQLNDSLLFGLSQAGGYYGDGAIYKFNISTRTETVVYSFGSTGTDAQTCTDAALIQATDGLLYGLSSGGGAYGLGTIFSFKPSSGVETVVHSFGNGTDGSTAYGTLTQVTDSLLYGMTFIGGTHSDGTIFSYNIYTKQETDVHDFGSGTDGQYPYYGPLLKASDGLLYGLTNQGGANYYGIIFSFDVSTNTESNLLSFGGNGYGHYPYGGFIEDDVTGVNQLAVNNNQLSIYPNPSSDFIHTSIQLKQTSDLQLRLVNMLGQTMWSADAGNVSNYQNNISVANLVDGVYLLEMITGNGTESKKVVVTK